MKGHALAGLAVVAILALAFLLGREGKTPGTRIETAANSEDFGYIARDAKVLQTAADGSPLYALDANRVEQDPNSGDVNAQQLTLRYATDETRRWTLTAREARLPGGSSLLHLEGDVQATGTPAGSSIPARIATPRLDYDTRSQDVRTRDEVRIDWGRQRLEAQGLTANLKRGQLALESKVHARLLP